MTHNIQPPVTIKESFVPSGCSDPGIPAVSYGAGQTFDGIYETLHKKGYMV